MGYQLAAAATLALLVLLLIAEWRENRKAIALLKPLVSTGFVVAGFLAPTDAGLYAVVILAGLVLSWWGDVLLIPRDRPAVFRLGILAFLLGHVAYSTAFLARGVDWTATLASAVLMTALAMLVLRWLAAHTPDDMRLPVRAYVAVISTMLALAVGTWAAHGEPLIVVGAAMFYVSDLSVAADRFVRRSFLNRLWGLPCYYIAQLVLAFTIASVP
ncbi:MAG: lysoplasmalogenase [Candidatus Binatia bacterium]